MKFDIWNGFHKLFQMWVTRNVTLRIWQKIRWDPSNNLSSAQSWLTFVCSRALPWPTLSQGKLDPVIICDGTVCTRVLRLLLQKGGLKPAGRALWKTVSTFIYVTLLENSPFIKDFHPCIHFLIFFIPATFICTANNEIGPPHHLHLEVTVETQSVKLTLLCCDTTQLLYPAKDGEGSVLLRHRGHEYIFGC